MGGGLSYFQVRELSGGIFVAHLTYWQPRALVKDREPCYYHAAGHLGKLDDIPWWPQVLYRIQVCTYRVCDLPSWVISLAYYFRSRVKVLLFHLIRSFEVALAVPVEDIGKKML